MVAILYRFYDVQNLKAIFRGVDRQVPPPEIGPALLPVGELTDTLLADLVRAPGPRYVIDLLASIGLPFAQPLLHLRAEHPGAGTLEMELALDKWYFQESFQALQYNGQHEVLLAALQLEADLINLLTVLRFAFAPEEHKHLRDRFNTENIADLFVGPGKIPTQVLTQAGHQDSVEAAVATLVETLYAHPLKAGLETYTRSALLSTFERELKRFRLKWMSGLMMKDPLGIGVPTGYLALKINEVNNLRWIAQGIHMGLKTDTIRKELEVLA
jgi:vacuolar-type H+-ATPase subunit C/Vma6